MTVATAKRVQPGVLLIDIGIEIHYRQFRIQDVMCCPCRSGKHECPERNRTFLHPISCETKGARPARSTGKIPDYSRALHAQQEFPDGDDSYSFLLPFTLGVKDIGIDRFVPEFFDKLF